MDLYPHLPKIILNAQIAQFAGRRLRVWIIEGEDAIATVTHFKGSDNDPMKCAPYTLRYKIARMIGSRSFTLQGDTEQENVTCYDNNLHAPKRDEIESNMLVFEKFIR